ncbi:MAG: polysaccharide deacetylase [Comamonadaceae bacterium]|nr:MAG: polysaccharide deacetylase [Comamonadaceae bacterium]
MQSHPPVSPAPAGSAPPFSPRVLGHHGLFAYSAIRGRPVYDWPEGKRLAVYIGFNLEHFSYGDGLGANLGPASPHPDVLNYAWREYGNRVGAWRCLDLFDALDLPTGALVNTSLYDHCPELVAAFAGRGDEIIGHGHTNAERQSDMDASGERALLVHCRDQIARHSGKAPAGWLSPWISESPVTSHLLAETGYRYTLNWSHDDQPVRMDTRSGPLWSIPYPQELNDIPMIIARQMDAKDFAQMIIDNFDEMLVQSQAGPLVMGIALHPYIVGQPYRLRHLRRALEHIARQRGDIWFTTPGAICSHLDSSLS